MFSKLFAATVLATAASAHMKLSSPVPYGASSLQNGPLKLDGSDFPCQHRDHGYDLEGASNIYAQGSTQKLAFLGTAVHGGGSCQVSVTTDAQPDKNSVWKVIKTIEGGCPAKGQEGNMGDNAAAVDPFTYDYTIPKELQAGNYTLAWTWFNKVGNREMYMNCAPLTVTGSGGSKGFLNTLPDMFQANVFGEDGCRTQADVDLQFPNPGIDVDRFNGASSAFGGPTVTVRGTKTCATATGGAAPTNGGSGSAPTGSPAQPTQSSVPGGVFITSPPASQPAASQPAASQPAASQPAVSQPAVSQPAASQPAVSQPVATSAPVASPPAQSQAPAPAATSAAAPPPAPSSGSNASVGSSPKSGFAAGTACSTEGQWNCIDGTHFQRCASGSWSASMAVAAGTSCQSGQAASLSMVAKRGKKSMRHAVRMRA